MDQLVRLFTSPWHFIVSLGRDPNTRFWFLVSLATAGYVLFIVAMLVATAVHSTPGDLLSALQSKEIQHSIYLSLLTCSLTALLSLLVAVPIGYLLARRRFFGKALVESILDIPIVLPPMVIGLCLLILFQTRMGGFVDSVITFTYTVFGVVLAQFVIGVAFAIRTNLVLIALVGFSPAWKAVVNPEQRTRAAEEDATPRKSEPAAQPGVRYRARQAGCAVQ